MVTSLDSVLPYLPYLRLATAGLPIVVAMFLRAALGKNRLTGVLVSCAVTWFALNVVLSPFTDFSRLSGWLAR